MSANNKYIRFQLFAVLVGMVILVIKFLAFYLTNSDAIFSDALESIVNVVAGSFALYSLILAAKPKDRDHPYGHGKIEFISAGIEGTLILIAAVGIIYKAVESLITEHELMHLDLGIYLAGGAGLINYVLGWWTEHYGEKNQSPTMIASGKHLKSDGYTSAGLILALVVVKVTGLTWIDSVIALGFGGLIGVIGVREIRKSLAGIMDEADFTLLEELISDIDTDRNENWIDLHNFRAQKFGKAIHIDCHLTLPHYLTVAQGHDEVRKVENLVKTKYPGAVEMFIHSDPCVPSSCQICTKQDCPVRNSDFRERISWEMDSVLQNRKHQ